jgi:hypothetical protein
MRHNAAKFVPRLLSSDKKEYRIAVCTQLKEQAKNDLNFISNIITGDKFGCLGMTLRQSSSRLSGRFQLHNDQRKRDYSEQWQIDVGLFF